MPLAVSNISLEPMTQSSKQSTSTYAHLAESDSGLVQGFSASRLARIADVMQEQVDADQFPGAVTMVARHGEVVHYASHGFQDAAKSKRMSKDSIFRLASMTKPLVTAAAMILVERGRMNMFDPIVKWLPELKDLKVETPQGDVPLERPIWVQDLMRHTAGFVYGGRAASPRIAKLYTDLNIESREHDITTEDMLRNLGKIPLAHQPGSYWEYSISIDVLGLLLERLENKSLDLIVKELLTDPLEMPDTTWWVAPDEFGRVAEALDSDPLKAEMLKGYRQTQNPVGRTYLRGGGGMLGTAQDYMRFLQMMLNGGLFEGRRYLSRKTVEYMLSNHSAGMGGTTIANTGPGYGFGLGFAVRLEQGMGWVPGSVGDAMWAGIWGTSFWLDPRENLAALIMTQGPTSKTHSRMLYKSLVYGALMK